MPSICLPLIIVGRRIRVLFLQQVQSLLKVAPIAAGLFPFLLFSSLFQFNNPDPDRQSFSQNLNMVSRREATELPHSILDHYEI